MALMTWNPSFSVKVKHFDDQHVKLVAMLNDLHHAKEIGKGNEVLGSILTELISYTASHFADEENLMIQYSFPDTPQHRSTHAALVNQVFDLQNRFKAGNADLTHEVLDFLKGWLIKHIQGDDRRLGVYLNTKGIV